MVPAEENPTRTLAPGILYSSGPSLKTNKPNPNKTQTGFHSMGRSILITDLFVIGED